MLEIGRLEGISAAPEGGAALTAIRKLVVEGRIKRDEVVVLFNTGGALKYLDVLRSRTESSQFKVQSSK
jgi:threonine synthase